MTDAGREYRYTLRDITVFLGGELGVPADRISADADISNDLGCGGDDFSEMMAKYSVRFSVPLDLYQWRFHHGPEGIDLVALRFPHIPLTPQVLLEAANDGRWPLEYPDQDQFLQPRLTWWLRSFAIAGLLVFCACLLAAYFHTQ